jgi:hypothetical protein
MKALIRITRPYAKWMPGDEASFDLETAYRITHHLNPRRGEFLGYVAEDPAETKEVDRKNKALAKALKAGEAAEMDEVKPPTAAELPEGVTGEVRVPNPTADHIEEAREEGVVGG